MPLPETSYCHQSDKSDVHFQSQTVGNMAGSKSCCFGGGGGGEERKGGLMCAQDEVISSAGYSRCAGLTRLSNGVIFFFNTSAV